MIRRFIGSVERWIGAAATLEALRREHRKPRRVVVGWFRSGTPAKDARRRAEAEAAPVEGGVSFGDVERARAKAKAARDTVLAQWEELLKFVRKHSIDAAAVARVVVAVEGQRLGAARKHWPDAKALLMAASPANVRPKKHGRKKADYETIQLERAIAEEWARARDSGVHKVDFAHDNDMSLKEFDRLLDRDAKRKRHSE